MEAKRHVAQAQSLEIQEKESSDYIEICMQAQGYEIVEDDCPTYMRTDSIPKSDPNFYSSLSQQQKNSVNIELGRKIRVVEGMQRIEPACYEPMEWFGKRFLRFENGWEPQIRMFPDFLSI